MAEEYTCSFNHPIFSIIDNPTRRNMLRLLACEANYGNRLASILKISNTSIHRHIKSLEGDGEYEFIKTDRTINEYDGRKGADANLYEVGTKIGLIFSIFPNFVHSQIIEHHEGEFVKPPSSAHPENVLGEINLMDVNELAELVDDDDLVRITSEFHEIKKEVSEVNKHIEDIQTQLMHAFKKKNELMGKITGNLRNRDDLNYEERVIMRSLIAYGSICSSNIVDLLSMNQETMRSIVEGLKKKNWLTYKSE